MKDFLVLNGDTIPTRYFHTDSIAKARAKVSQLGYNTSKTSICKFYEGRFVPVTMTVAPLLRSIDLWKELAIILAVHNNLVANLPSNCRIDRNIERCPL